MAKETVVDQACDCEAESRALAKDIVAKIGSEPESAIPLLQEIQKRQGYLAEEVVAAVAEEAGLSVSHLYGVATFYAQFRFTPQGKYLIRLCRGTACHVAGADLLAETIRETIGVDEGETTEDMLFSYEGVACLGCCSLAPVVTIGEQIYGKQTPAKLRKVLREYKK